MERRERALEPDEEDAKVKVRTRKLRSQKTGKKQSGHPILHNSWGMTMKLKIGIRRQLSIGKH